MLYLRLFYMVWMLGMGIVLLVAISQALFSGASAANRLRQLGISLLLAPLWPFAVLTAAGRRRLLGALRDND